MIRSAIYFLISLSDNYHFVIAIRGWLAWVKYSRIKKFRNGCATKVQAGWYKFAYSNTVIWFNPAVINKFNRYNRCIITIVAIKGWLARIHFKQWIEVANESAIVIQKCNIVQLIGILSLMIASHLHLTLDIHTPITYY